jgi:hypothetical protein
MPAAWPEKKIFPEDDFFNWMPIFMVNNLVNLFEGGCLISCSVPVRPRGPGKIAAAIQYPQAGKFLQFLS